VEATIAQTLFTFAILLIFGGFLAWALLTRQFHDVEEANDRLFGAAEGEQTAADTGEVSR